MEIYLWNYDINIDNGLYFGIKNLYTENKNIFISEFGTIKKNIKGNKKEYNEKKNLL